MEQRPRGLTGYHLKVIALFFMTIDHLAAYGSGLAIFEGVYLWMRILGRIAAPLFLFMIAEGARHSRSRPRYILRLYGMGVLTGLFTAATNFFLGERWGVFQPGNILFTFFYTALYIHLLEGARGAWRGGRRLGVLPWCLGLLATLLPLLLQFWLQGILSAPPLPLGQREIQLAWDLHDSLVPSPWGIDYSPMFLLMGVLWYFLPGPGRRVIILAAFSLLSLVGAGLRGNMPLGAWEGFFNAVQSLMILALPFLWLYNGQKGWGQKYFFYAYYPLHRYLIHIAAVLWGA